MKKKTGKDNHSVVQPGWASFPVNFSCTLFPTFTLPNLRELCASAVMPFAGYPGRGPGNRGPAFRGHRQAKPAPGDVPGHHGPGAG